MKYEVRKGGKVYMNTSHGTCRYSPQVEASIQNAGYSIHIDGKMLPKQKALKKKQRRSKDETYQ